LHFRVPKECLFRSPSFRAQYLHLILGVITALVITRFNTYRPTYTYCRLYSVQSWRREQFFHLAFIFRSLQWSPERGTYRNLLLLWINLYFTFLKTKYLKPFLHAHGFLREILHSMFIRGASPPPPKLGVILYGGYVILLGMAYQTQATENVPFHVTVNI